MLTMANANTYEATMTIRHNYNQLCMQHGLDLVTSTQHTLNNKHGIFANDIPSTVGANYPAIRYFGIGIGGTAVTQINNGVATISCYRPNATDTDLYIPIPFRIRAIGNDLPTEERSKYRLRTIEYYDGMQYIVYWLKNFDSVGEVSLQQTDFNSGSTSAFIYPTTGLNTPVSPVTDTILIGSRIFAQIPVTLLLTGEEYAEVKDIYPEIVNLAGGTCLINELGFYSGIDAVKVHPNDSIQYTEAIYTELASHVCVPGYDLTSDISQITLRHYFENGRSVIIN